MTPLAHSLTGPQHQLQGDAIASKKYLQNDINVEIVLEIVGDNVVDNVNMTFSWIVVDGVKAVVKFTISGVLVLGVIVEVVKFT